MKKENAQFYILVICSIIIYITSFFSNSSTTTASLAIIFMTISVSKSEDILLSKISKVILVLMIIGFFYSILIQNI